MSLFLILICIVFLIILFCPVIVIESMDNIQQPQVQSQPVYQEYSNNPTIMEYKNAANIEYLKDQVNKLSGIPEQMNSLQKQVEILFNQQSSFAASITDTKQPTVE